MREKILRTLARLHAQYPWKILLLVLVITLILGVFATQLEQSMRWTDLLPSKSEKTIQYNKVIDEFVSATNIIIVVEGNEDTIKAFAEQIGIEPERLVKQLGEAGVAGKSVEDSLRDDEKRQLL